jgi:hypothetical protein
MSVHLDSASVEAVARRVAELLGGGDEDELVDAAEIARRFGVSRDYVYEHADDLGAVRLGDGPKARLRFAPEVVRERLGAERSKSRRAGPRRPQRSDRELLRVRGEP